MCTLAHTVRGDSPTVLTAAHLPSSSSPPSSSPVQSMDRAALAHPGVKPPDPAHSAPPASLSSTPTVPSRQSPPTPLVPLEFLQNQRRGSITDPSLHAAGPSSAAAHTPAHPASAGSSKLPRRTRAAADSSAAPAQQTIPPFRFGDPPDSASPHLRRLLRSPSTDSGRRSSGTDSRRGSEGTSRDANGTRDGDHMDVDPQSSQQQADGAAYDGRRPSLAGIKRKISPEHNAQGSNGEIDPKLIGPGVQPSGGGADGQEGPAPKRRSSAFDTRLAALQLNDRRGSLDARGTLDARGGNGGGGLVGGSGMGSPGVGVFAVGAGAGTAFAGDPPHGRPPPGIATFAWPASTLSDQPQQTGPPPQGSDANNMASNPGPYDPNLPMVSPGSFSPDRRMSAPAGPPENMSARPASGPARVLRSRSRPPSRVRGSSDQLPLGAEPSPGSSNPNSIPEDADASQTSQRSPTKEPGSTPYSRSPELRVSHKLAERKRRKEMKDLFDELRDQLPADRGMKASKWEILSKAIDFVVNLKQGSEQMSAEIAQLRHEVDTLRQAQGLPPYQPGGPPLPPPVLYAHGPPVGMPPFPGPPPPAGPGVPTQQPPPHHPQPMPPQQAPVSRPGSSQNVYPPGVAPPSNGAVGQAGVPRADAPS